MDDIQEALANLKEKGWTLASIADELGYLPGTVRKWASGGVTHRYPHNAPSVKRDLERLMLKKRIPKQKRYG